MDYEAANGTLHFAAYETEKAVDLKIIDDCNFEPPAALKFSIPNMKNIRDQKHDVMALVLLVAKCKCYFEPPAAPKL